MGRQTERAVDICLTGPQEVAQKTVLRAQTEMEDGIPPSAGEAQWALGDSAEGASQS